MPYHPDSALEAAVIRRFVEPARQERFLGFVAQARTRPKFIRELHHLQFLRYELFERVPAGEHAFIQQRLRAFPHLTSCYVISEDARIDQHVLPIEEGLSHVIGADMGSLLVFGQAELVYAEAEGVNLRWLSR